MALGTTKDAVHYEVERIAAIEERSEHTAASALTEKSEAAVSPVSAPSVGAYRTDELVRFVYGIILWQQQGQEQEGTEGHESIFDSAEMGTVLKEAVGENTWRTLLDLEELEKNKLIFEAERHCAELPVPALLTQFHGFLKEITGRILKRELGDARIQLRQAEVAGDEEAMNRYLEECAVLQKRLSSVGGVS
jgi:hypothetical protein